MAIRDMWTYDHAVQGSTDLSTGSGGPSYSETGLYNQYTGNPGYAYNNGITNAIQATTDGYLTMNSSSTSNPGLAVQAKEVQDWSVATQYWLGFRTKTSKQNASNANVFTMSDTIGQANPTVMVQESDLTAANANTLNQDYYVEIFIDRTNKVFQVYVNGTQVKSGNIAAASIVTGGNGFYWFGPWNSGLTANASRAFRDFYWLDVDSTTPGRLGPVRSNMSPIAAALAPNYATTVNSSFVGTAAVSNAQSKFGGSSLSLPGSGSYMTIPQANGWTPGTGDFTLEGFFYVSNIALQSADNSYLWPMFFWGNWFASGQPINLATYYYENSYGVTGGVFAIVAGSPYTSVSFQLPGTSTLSRNAWHHVVFQRTNGVVQCYVDGVQVGTNQNWTQNVSVVTAQPIILGRAAGGTNNVFWYAYGNADELRMSNIARYSGAFTPPAAQFQVDANTMMLYHFDAAPGGLVADSAIGGPAATLNTGYPTPPGVLPSLISPSTDDPLTATFAKTVSDQSSILAVDYRVAALSSSAANLNASLSDGTNTQALSPYAFADTNTMKYGRRIALATKAADGGIWTPTKVAANQLILTPTN